MMPDVRSAHPLNPGDVIFMKSILSLCVAGLALSAAPAAAAGITYDCDTAADHFSELVLPSGSVPFTVSGNVKLNTLAGSKKFVPVTRVQIVDPAAPGQQPSAAAGFSLGALPMDAKKSPTGEAVVQMISYSVNGKDDEFLPMSVMTKPGTVQPFVLTYDGSTVAVTLGKETKSIPMKAAAPALRIMCSTGEFLFTDLTVAPGR